MGGLDFDSRLRQLILNTVPDTSEEAVDQPRAAARLPILQADLRALAEMELDLCYFDPDQTEETTPGSQPRPSSWVP